MFQHMPNDSFKPNFDPILNFGKYELYLEFSNEFHEKTTHHEHFIQQMRKENLKYRYKCLHESLLTKINMFDDELLQLETERKDIKLQITFKNLFLSTLQEELLILNDFDLLEDKYSYDLYLKTVKQNEKVNEVKYLSKLI